MLRTFRKYNKWILVVGGSLLMVTFLISGSAGQFQKDPSKQVVGTLNGDSITAGNMFLAQREFEALKMVLGESYLASIGNGINDSTTWFLLSHEANNAGLIGFEVDGRDWLPVLGERKAMSKLRSADQSELMREVQRAGSFQAFQTQYVLATTNELANALDTAGAQSQLSSIEMERVLAKLRGVERLMELTFGAPRLSDVRLIVEARREADQATIDAALVPASALESSVVEPTPEELATQFAKYAAVAPDVEGLGFGYLQPPRVKMAWLTLDRAGIANSIQLDPLAVNKHWQQNRSSFPGEFSVERPNVEAILRDQRADSILAEADRILKARVNQATRNLETVGSHKVLAADWDDKRPTLEALAVEVVNGIKEFSSITIPTPIITRKESTFTPVKSLDSLDEIGTAVYTSATARLPLSRLVERVKELWPTSDLDLQTNIPFVATPLINAVGNRSYIEITDARPESAATSIDEVRDAVVRDARLAKAYERLTSELPELRVLASLRGLDAVKESIETRFPGSSITPVRQVQITRSQVSFLAQQMNDPAFRNAVMDAADALSPTVPLDESNADARSVGVSLPRVRGVVIAQVVSREPLTKEMVRTFNQEQFISLMINERRRLLPGEATFAKEALSTRLNFVDKEAPQKTKESAASTQ